MKSAVKIVLLVCVLCSVTFTQDAARPKVAVYVTGGKTTAENQAFIARITHGLVNSGRYTTIERTDIFLDQVAREQKTQRSGAIDDKQISAIGKQHGAAFVCVGEIVDAFGGFQLSTRILNVESAQVTATGVAAGQLNNIDDFVALSNEAVALMLGERITPRQTMPSNIRTYDPQALTQPSTPSTQATAGTRGTNAAAPAATARTGTAFVDPRDGKSYQIKTIGQKTWFMQDLAYVKDKYTWEEANKACPRGWHTPTDEEWQALKDDIELADMRFFQKDGRWWSTGVWTTNMGSYFWHVSNGVITRSMARNETGLSARCVKD